MNKDTEHAVLHMAHHASQEFSKAAGEAFRSGAPFAGALGAGATAAVGGPAVVAAAVAAAPVVLGAAVVGAIGFGLYKLFED
ncbi:MAG: hypothetical protein ACK52P_06855 [Alphaproteobacteria bacterium]